MSPKYKPGFEFFYNDLIATVWVAIDSVQTMYMVSLDYKEFVVLTQANIDNAIDKWNEVS